MAKKIIISTIIGFISIGLIFVLFKNIKNSSAPEITQSKKIQVIASFYPLYFFSTQISGDKAETTNIVPSGVEPHEYEPTSQDMAKIENSQLIILNGSGLEVWGNNIQKNIDIKNTIIVSAGEGLITKKTTADGQTITDPHVWLAPPLAQKMIDKITEGFKQVDPQNKNYYETNASLLKNKLSDLDTAYKQGLSRCQEKNIITSHTAFSYLATTYGFNQVSIAGLSPDAEPSSQQLANIVDFSRKNKVSYIFFESLVSPKLAQTIATEIGAQTLVLDPIEGLTDEKKLAGKNYLSIMQDNLINLQIALKCTK